MKYITTDKHPEYKEGLIFEAEYPAYFVLDRNRVIEEDIQKGYIKEVQEKEFTKDDMYEFGTFFKGRVRSSTYHLAWEDEFNAWLKQRK